jgi:hypothetical protein
MLLVTLALIAATMPLQAQESAPITIRLQAPAQVLVGEPIPLTLQIGAGADLVGGLETLAVFDPPPVLPQNVKKWGLLSPP